jgi:fermentation-respiration switch protein FrsA (DUF1100 family)
VLKAIVAGAAGVVAAVLAVGFVLSAPAHETIGPAPPDLPVEAVNIASASGATLHGWFVAGRPGTGAVVLLHGVRANRLAMLRRAKLLHGAGLAVLLFDFQAHGESTGVRITFGRLEGLDARAAVAFMRERLPRERIGAIGSSLGGAAALLGPAPPPVDALVLESVYPDIGSAIANRVRVVLGSTLGDIAAPATAWLFQLILQPFLGVKSADLRPIDHISAVTAPVLVACGTQDDRTTIIETRAMFERVRAPKVFWAVDGAGHVDLESYAPAAYRDHVLAFLIERLREPR